MTPNRTSKPRGSWFAIGTHLLLTLLTLCLIFEILRLLTFTSATPVTHLAQRRDDTGPNDPSMYQGVIDHIIGSSESSKRDFLGDFTGAFDDFGKSVKNIFHPDGGKKTPVEVVAQYAYDELNHQIPLKDLKEAFKKRYGKMKHSGDKQTDDEEWVEDQIENVIPELKKRYDEADKTNSASKHHERDAGEDLKTTSKKGRNKIRSEAFVYEGQPKSAVDWVSLYAYE